MAAPPLVSLSISGLLSIRSLKLDLTSEVTILVGPNGSGKSNIVSAFELLGRVVDGQLNEYVLRRGGMDRLLTRSANPSAGAENIELEAWGLKRGSRSNGYKAAVLPATEDTAVVQETSYFHDHKSELPDEQYLGTSRESVLRETATKTARSRHVLEVLSGCRVFHFDDTSSDAPSKRRTDVGDSITLQPDARNLAAVLHDMRTEHPDSYRRLVRAVRTVAPYFDDFVLKPQAGSLVLRWRERGLDGVFSADALSDGTLRFICLTTLLLQPNPPATIVLDEPELGLHPFAIHQLAHLVRAAARGRRILAATQSVTLLEQFAVDEVAVVERTSRGTNVSRPEAGALEEWLSDYSLGELWQKNVLGGRPDIDPASVRRRLVSSRSTR